MAVVHLSPELPRLTVRGHRREDSEDFLSASYPSPTETAALGQLQRSYSGRPRSQSSYPDSPGMAAAAKQRKSLRGLGRSRVAAGMSGWMKGRGSNAGAATEGPHRRASASDADGASTEQIDSAFAEIKKQLAKLSEEDHVLKERVDKLNEELSILHTPVQKARELRYQEQRRRSGRHASPPAWKSPHFSNTISEGGFSSRFSIPRGSLPILMVSSSSRDSLRDAGNDFADPAHEVIAEREEEEGKQDLGGSIADGYQDTNERGAVNHPLTRDTLPLTPTYGVGRDTCHSSTQGHI